jgi:hypothetical protein
VAVPSAGYHSSVKFSTTVGTAGRVFLLTKQCSKTFHGLGTLKAARFYFI